jgi:hypothetical protein
VFWWFERRGKYLRYEAREVSGGTYELCVIDAEGLERVERFADSSELAKRQVEFEREIALQGWTGPHGWNV